MSRVIHMQFLLNNQLWIEPFIMIDVSRAIWDLDRISFIFVIRHVLI